MKSQFDDSVIWINGNLMKWQFDEMAIWWIGNFMKCKVDGMASLCNDKLTLW